MSEHPTGMAAGSPLKGRHRVLVPKCNDSVVWSLWEHEHMEVEIRVCFRRIEKHHCLGLRCMTGWIEVACFGQTSKLQRQFGKAHILKKTTSKKFLIPLTFWRTLHVFCSEHTIISSASLFVLCDFFMMGDKNLGPEWDFSFPAKLSLSSVWEVELLKSPGGLLAE